MSENVKLENVVYVEPNYTYSWHQKLFDDGLDTNQSNIFEMTPPLENYCIAVDLEVEVLNRGNGRFSNPTKTFICSWSSKSDGKSETSFFQGTKHTFRSDEGSVKTINYLTSDPSTIGTYDDMKKYGTSECFGINSIDIQYNSYTVPEVTIEFTDIRGISLFAPEELRHQVVDENGIGGMFDSNSDVAGSFFKCFFTFPYPKFRLMVKGFYGEPTAYELTVCDFRASFDCNSGNFRATAKFVGYAFSLLNDITLNALVVSPLNEYGGKAHWDKNTTSESIDVPPRFSLDNGRPMPRFTELIKQVSEISDYLGKFSGDNPLAVKKKELDIQNQKLTTLINAYDSWFRKVIEVLTSMKIEGLKNNPLSPNGKTKTFALFTNDKEKTEKDIKTKLDGEVKTSFEQLKTNLTNYGGSLSVIPLNVNFELIDDNSRKKFNDNASLKGYKIPDGVKYIFIYDGSVLASKLTNHKTKNDNAITENNKEIINTQNQLITDSIGFNPTVENLTKILMAHFETLIYSIYECAKNVSSSRTASDLGLDTTDLVLSDGANVPPFPRVDKKNNEGDLSIVEEGWLADLPDGKDEQEVDFIEGLLKAVNVFNDETKKPAAVLFNGNENGSGSTNVGTVMKIPLCALDMVSGYHPFGEGLNFDDNISDFCGRLGFRMFSLFSLTNSDSNSYFSEKGEADAINFVTKYPNASKHFLDRLYGNVITADFIYNVLNDYYNVKNEKLNGVKWIWDSDNSSTSVPLIKENKLNLFNKSIKSKDDCRIVPFANIKWNEIKSLNDNQNNDGNYLDYSISTNYIEGKSCSNIFIIDENYGKYSNYKSLMKIDNDELNFVDSLNLDLDVDDYVEDWFRDDENVFAKTFKSTNNEITYSPIEGSCTLPNKKEIVKSFDSRNTKFNENDDFDTIISDGVEYERDSGWFWNNISFDSTSNEFGEITSFTIPTFKGIKNNKLTLSCSIFGQREYYELEDKAKALVFLETLKEDGDNGGIFIHKIIDALNEGKTFKYLPYCGLMLLGGYCWREKFIKDKGYDPTKHFCKDNLTTYKLIAESGEMSDNIGSVFELREEVKEVLVDKFEKWVKNDLGFKFYQEQFEIKSSKGDMTSLEFFDDLVNRIKISGYTDIEQYLYENASDSFYENYISFKLTSDKKSFKLFNRETSYSIIHLTNFFIRPSMVIKPTKYFKRNNSNDVVLNNGNAKTYLSSFITKIKELYNNRFESLKQNPIEVIPIETNEHIKISLYKYIKILWDKWLSGTEKEDWCLENFYEKNWYFIDSFYNKVGNKILLNIAEYCRDILYSQKENGYSLLSFISKAYAKNRFNLHCVQNFFDLNNNSEFTKFKNLFKPIPYSEIDFGNIDIHPSFLIMYTYEYSSKLDIEDAEYKGDSFNLNDKSDWPVPIATKTIKSGYRIPAFGVSYGKQYQSYFKDINVSMDNPIVTEQSIKAQFMIASMNSKNGESGKKIDFLGQDLYTIYSNNSYTCTVKMMGCAWIQPLMYFQLTNVPMFRGAYLIQKVTHHIEPGNMETTFVGTRMAKQQTKKVNKFINTCENNETAPENYMDDIQGEMATVTNDCEYKFFNPLVDNNFCGMTDEELDMTLSEYEKYKKGEFKLTASTKSVKVIDLLAATINTEASSEDELGKQLIAVVIFNRYMHFGGDLTKVFYGKQHSYQNSGSEKDKNIARQIFKNSPLILLGEKSKVSKQIPILDKGVDVGSRTQSKTIDEHMLKSMDGYITTNGYDLNHERGKNIEPKGWWHDAKYVLHHMPKKSYGHVFVAGFKKYDEEHWQAPNLSNDAETSTDKPSKKAVSLFNAIEQTIKYSNKTIADKLIMEKDEYDADSFYVKSEPIKGLVDVFDAIVNTYYDYVNDVNWIVNNDGSETPSKIKVKLFNDKSKKNISIVDKNLNILSQHEGLNEFFYITLAKKYGTIDTRNEGYFKTECPNFINLITNDSDWKTKVNNLLNKNIESCGIGSVNEHIVKGYQWVGSFRHSANHNVQPQGVLNERNGGVSAMVSKITALSTANKKGGCAAAVREAIQAGFDLKAWPVSACAYSRFLPVWGFVNIHNGYGGSLEGYKPIEGDISVISGEDVSPEPQPDNRNPRHGHIQIFDGKSWCSDFPCSKAWCYNDNRPYMIFRHKSKI